MFRHFNIVCAILVALFAASAAHAQNQHDERSDRTVYNRLVQQFRQVDAEYAQAESQALHEARGNKGEPSLESQARLISLRDRRDRITDRIAVIALRWGWEVPTPQQAAQDNPARPRLSARDEVFEPARYIIQARFEDESRRIAREVVLPVISLPIQ